MKNTQVQELKLVSITRTDLPNGYQAVQSSHSLIDFVIQHPEISKQWNLKSNYLVSLGVEDENHLEQISLKLSKLNIEHQKFYEPDIGNQLTSIAFMSDKKIRRKFSNLPLLLKSK